MTVLVRDAPTVNARAARRPAARVPAAAAYAELHCRSNYSFLDGASHPQELVERAGELGLAALALTDRSGLYGVVRAWEAARALAAKEGSAVPHLIYGSELELNGDGQPGGRAPDDAVVLLAASREGYATISRLISRGRLRAAKGAFALAQDEVLAALSATRDVVVLVGGPRSRLLRDLCEGGEVELRQTLGRWREACGEALYLELTRHRRPGEHERSLALAAHAQALGVPSVATNDVCFHVASRKKLHDVLSCIRRGCTLAAAGRALLPNAERRLKSAAQMQRLFADLPAALAHTLEIAQRCRFSLDELRYAYPVESLAPGESADASLARLARAGLVARLGSERAVELTPQLDKELRIIGQLSYAGYFLTMWDVVQFCRQQAILCQGRGSAANSLVCYATGITAVSPDQIDMLFERFVSLERREPPDIDLDIEHDRREEVIQYVYGKYGRERAAMVAEVIRYRHRSAARDVGKVLGLSEQTLARVTRFFAHGWQGVEDEAARAAGIDPQGRSWRLLLLLSAALVDFPRHLSIHVGGFVLSREPLERIVPLERARMAGRTVIAWDKDDLDALNIFKVDLLGLGMLNVIARAFRLIVAGQGPALELATVPREDPAVYAMLQRADSVGVFQVESRAQMNMLPRLQPRCFYDLVIEVALVRPGPIAGGMVHPYLRRRRGEERVEYPHPKLRAILERTLGVPIFQEQVMRIAVAVGGYSPGEADQLRRDMAAWRRHGRMEQHQQRLHAAMCAEGIAEPFAQRIIQQIEGFGSYGFPESHAASFAHLVYVSAYLKCHYPAAFAAALINAQPMGFYSVASIVADAHRHGVAIHGVDVQHSDWEAQVVDGPRGALRLGLRAVRGLGQRVAESIVAERGRGGPYRSIAELAARCTLARPQLVALALAGALGSVQRERRRAIWEATALGGNDLVANLELDEDSVSFAPLPPALELQLDYTHAESFVEGHPLRLHRARLQRRGVVCAAELVQQRPGDTVAVAGLVVVRQRPGSGKMIFMALEDETGLVDVAVPLALFERNRTLLLLSALLLVRGRLELDGAARAVLARQFEPFGGDALPARARDFH